MYNFSLRHLLESINSERIPWHIDRDDLPESIQISLYRKEESGQVPMLRREAETVDAAKKALDRHIEHLKGNTGFFTEPIDVERIIANVGEDATVTLNCSLIYARTIDGQVFYGQGPGQTLVITRNSKGCEP